MRKVLFLSFVLMATASVHLMADLQGDLSNLQMQLTSLQEKLNAFEPLRPLPPLPPRPKKENLNADTRYQWLRYLQDNLVGNPLVNIASDGTEVNPGLKQYLQYFTGIQTDLINKVYVEIDFPNDIKLLGQQIKAVLDRRKTSSPSPLPASTDITRSPQYNLLKGRLGQLANISTVKIGVLNATLEAYNVLSQNIADKKFTTNKMPDDVVGIKAKIEAELAERAKAVPAPAPTDDLSKMTSKQKAEKRDELEKNIRTEITIYKRNSSAYPNEKLQALSKQIDEYVKVAGSIDENDAEYQEPDLAIMQFRVILFPFAGQ